MPTDRDQVIALLTELVSVNRAILRALSPSTPADARSSSAAVASDSDLDSQYGDPQIKGKDPRNWKGPTMRGRKYSECPPEYLDMVAELCDWQAGEAAKKDERTAAGKPVADYRRKDAARARGWAARIRAGKVQQAPSGPLGGPAFEEPTYPAASADPGFAAGEFMPSNWANER